MNHIEKHEFWISIHSRSRIAQIRQCARAYPCGRFSTIISPYMLRYTHNALSPTNRSKSVTDEFWGRWILTLELHWSISLLFLSWIVSTKSVTRVFQHCRMDLRSLSMLVPHEMSVLDWFALPWPASSNSRAWRSERSLELKSQSTRYSMKWSKMDFVQNWSDSEISLP